MPARGVRAGSKRRDSKGRVTLLRMDNVGIVVESLDAAIAFFAELGLELEGRATLEGEWAGRVTGLGDQRVEIAMMRTPDGHSRLELSRFVTPAAVADHRNAPVNSLGYLRVMFAVDDIDETLGRLRKHAPTPKPRRRVRGHAHAETKSAPAPTRSSANTRPSARSCSPS